MQAIQSTDNALDAPLVSKTTMERITAGLATITMVVFSFTGFASADSIMTSGPGSTNATSNSINANCETENDNTVDLSLANDQAAETGEAIATESTEAGNAESGDVTNEKATSVNADIKNGGNGPCVCTAAVLAPSANNTVSTTGPDSSNEITNEVNVNSEVTSTNVVDMTVNNDQTAESGDAFSSKNTEGGDAISGDAINANTTAFLLSLHNEASASPFAATPAGCAGHVGTGGGTANPVGPATVTGGIGGGTIFAQPSSLSRGGGNGSGFASNNLRHSGASRDYSAPAAAPARIATAAAPSVAVSPAAAPSQSAPFTPAYVAPSSSISNTGPSSDNSISQSYNYNSSTTNTNSFSSTSANTQTTTSGDAVSSNNTDGGDAQTGDNENYSSSGTAIAIRNL